MVADPVGAARCQHVDQVRPLLEHLLQLGQRLLQLVDGDLAVAAGTR